MCGLTGFWQPGAQADALAPVARAMAARIAHRGPDDDGVWADAEAGIALAHRRLSILDLSPAGHQPMPSASGRWVIAFNGEIYNHQDLRAELERAGAAPAWRGHSDTETLLAGIEAWGVDATLKRCTGMFAFAAWDRAERRLWLARDRIGEKPLYYGWQGDTFLFGSELKALRAHPAFTGGVDRGALALLLRHNYIPAPHSIHPGIAKLPPGTWLALSAGQRDAAPVAYWSLGEVAERGMASPFAGGDDEAVAQLEQLLGDAVRGQMVADVPLGALLSGGIDSTLITALMQARSARPVRTFTIGFEEGAYDEAAHARAVAAHLGTEHTELRLSADDALGLIPALPSMYDEPFADSSQLPTHLVMKLARQHVTVALSGDAGDEFFGGYNRYFLGPQLWRKVGWLPAPVRNALFRSAPALPSGLAARLGAAQAHDKLHKLARVFSGRSIRNLDDLYCGLVSEWLDPAGMVVDGHLPPNLLDDRTRWPQLSNPVARMMALDGLTYLPDDILVKVDRASMAVSLETRAPFLDHAVMEFAWSLPMHMKLRDGRGKWILRQLLDRHVPRALVERPKMGFGIPLDDWLRGPLRDWAEALLDESRLRREGYLDPRPVRAAWHRHLCGEASFGYRLWSVLMFQAWLEQG
ncbi:asparagine synthase (glutamine-hydrolyzing) [Pseudoxanthomonas koreensis]|uniref:asparagine synthase (glutamine-hydrolyzing) n=1 Tax=Pseudoxanthomonas koreensis TaxID=266061 RepID=UPI001391B098|nr:asparagine synthase (glutamine-hydrolyzing) [Pseudoxanthomonas koreensis]KAF1695311.1 asparagine synthase (glutamine-hydrolyzing) [Pseudoxanthomonas koreensis]